MIRSPCQVLATRLHPVAPDADFPEAASNALDAMRKALACRPPEDLAAAALMADELAAMVHAGESVDSTDVALARALADGLKRLAATT